MENGCVMMFGIYIGVVGLVIFQFVFILLQLKFFWKDHRKRLFSELPSVSVLVAARNEEVDLPDLLRSFERVDYPEDRIQFLFADDQSTDQTAEILKVWCDKSPNRIFLTIDSSQFRQYNKNGKANALAILGEKATG